MKILFTQPWASDTRWITHHFLPRHTKTTSASNTPAQTASEFTRPRWTLLFHSNICSDFPHSREELISIKAIMLPLRIFPETIAIPSALILEKAMAAHSSTLAWKIPWTEEPGGLPFMGSHRVRHDWATSLSLFTFMHWRRKWHPTPVFLPGESQGWGCLVGCCLWGRTDSDMTEATWQKQLLLFGCQRGLSKHQAGE